MKLSRAAWNNVIIFSVMGMILIINVANKRLFPEDGNVSAGQEASILGEHAVILTLEVANQLTVERIGKTWGIQPELMNEQALEQMMLAWQQSTGYVQSAPEEVTQTKAIEVIIYLAGQAQVTKLHLYPQQDQLLIHNLSSDVWLSLPILIYRQLLPVQLMSIN